MNKIQEKINDYIKNKNATIHKSFFTSDSFLDKKKEKYPNIIGVFVLKTPSKNRRLYIVDKKCEKHGWQDLVICRDNTLDNNQCPMCIKYKLRENGKKTINFKNNEDILSRIKTLSINTTYDNIQIINNEQYYAKMTCSKCGNIKFVPKSEIRVAKNQCKCEIKRRYKEKTKDNINIQIKHFKDFAEKEWIQYCNQHNYTFVSLFRYGNSWSCNAKCSKGHLRKIHYKRDDLQECRECYLLNEKIKTDQRIADLCKKYNYRHIYTNLNKEDSDKYKIGLKCNKNHIYEIETNQFTGVECPICNSSKLERKMISILDKYNIIYQTEYYVKEINSRFDFYLSDYNMFIEMDGIQHYTPVVFAKNKIEYSKEKDQVKNQYCLDNNIKLLRVPYWHNDLESVISQLDEINGIANLYQKYMYSNWKDEVKFFIHQQNLKEDSFLLFDNNQKVIKQDNKFVIQECWWKTKKRIIATRILSKNNKLQKIYARKTQVVIISQKETDNFYNKYHLFGQCRSGTINIGLIYDDELISLVSFSKDKCKNCYKLERYASKLAVLGGFNKIMKHFITDYNPKQIITFVDKDWSNIDNIYTRYGFEMTNQEVNPTYYYTDNEKIYHRFRFRKSGIKRFFPNIYDENLTERQMMNKTNFVRVYNAGLIKLQLDIR